MILIKDIIKFWKETWIDNKLVFFLEALGTSSSMIAAIILATSAVPNLVAVFIFYVIGSVCLMYVSHYRRSSWMLVMFLFFTIMNFIGLWTHLGYN